MLLVLPLTPPPNHLSAMPTVGRVRPLADYTWPDSHTETWSLLTRSADHPWGIEVYNRPRHDYYAVRRAFLTSYQFSIRESFRKRMARAARELSMEAMAALRGIPSRVSARGLGCRRVRAFLPGLQHLPSLMSPVRCFTGRKGRVVV